MRVAGVPGAIAATLGCVLPSCLLSLLLIWFYKKYQSTRILGGAVDGLKSMTTALIASTTLSIILNMLFGAKHLPLNFIRHGKVDFKLNSTGQRFIQPACEIGG